MMGQVILPMMCRRSGTTSSEYPGYNSQAIWSIVIAMIAIAFMELAFNVRFIVHHKIQELYFHPFKTGSVFSVYHTASRFYKSFMNRMKRLQRVSSFCFPERKEKSEKFLKTAATEKSGPYKQM